MLEKQDAILNATAWGKIWKTINLTNIHLKSYKITGDDDLDYLDELLVSLIPVISSTCTMIAPEKTLAAKPAIRSRSRNLIDWTLNEKCFVIISLRLQFKIWDCQISNELFWNKQFYLLMLLSTRIFWLPHNHDAIWI